MASLQVNNFHICSSGLFRKGFLLTTGQCSRYIENYITFDKATAVIGDLNLNKGQRVDLLKTKYCSKCDYNDDDIGVISVSKLQSCDFLRQLTGKYWVVQKVISFFMKTSH